MPKKIRELIQMLKKAGFVNRGGKGSHRNFKHAGGGKIKRSIKNVMLQRLFVRRRNEGR